MSLFYRIARKFHHGVTLMLRWRERYVPNMPFIFAPAVIIGLLTGTAAFLLKRMIGWVSLMLTSHLNAESANYILLVIPVAGILLTAIYTRYILHDNLAHGVRQLMHDLSQRMYRLKPHLTYAPMIASTMTLGFGGSAGSEGPIAYTGAAIGSNIGRLFRLSPLLMKIMIGCGAGAGIAGIFKAPVGGILFTLEVLGMELTTMSVLALVAAAVTSAMTAYAWSGCTIDIPFTAPVAFEASIIPYVIALGVFCGLYSLYYSFIMKKVEKMLDSFTNHWVKNLIGGGMLALLIFLFPTLYGEGYDTVGRIINGNASTIVNDSLFHDVTDTSWMLLLVVGGTLLAKCFATSATNSGGGVSGDFAPTLFAGCFAGFFFAFMMNKLFGLDLPTSTFAYFGMAGVMSGAIRAPFMAMFLTSEMAAGYTFFLPIVICAAISYGVVRLFTFDGFYSRHNDRNNGVISRIKDQS